MDRKELTHFAKSLWYVLGIRPDEFGLVPDLEGFVETKLLLQALREEPEWSFLNRGHLAELIHSPEGTRFEFQVDRVRAKNPMISMVPEATGCPPRRLFHAVRRRAHPVVLQHGMRPNKGPWVVMALTPEMALRIGKRRDPDPVVLEVKAEEASKRGVRFYATQGILFLA
ncbi:MAG: RNA 2'-phosphotransferase, partial [Thermodesulfobacteriota bacterium]